MLQLYLLRIFLWNAVGFMTRMTLRNIQTIAWLTHLNYCTPMLYYAIYKSITIYMIFQHVNIIIIIYKILDHTTSRTYYTILYHVIPYFNILPNITTYYNPIHTNQRELLGLWYSGWAWHGFSRSSASSKGRPCLSEFQDDSPPDNVLSYWEPMRPV